MSLYRHISTEPRRHVLFLVALCLLLFFADLGGRDLWDIDEGMHADIARAMLLSGDWITPRFNGDPFFDKPPLFNWLTAASFAILGLSEFAARLPAALSSLLCVLLTYAMGRALFTPRTGLLAGIVLATSLEFMLLARAVQYDSPFTLFITLSMCGYVFAMLSPHRSRPAWLLLYVGAALAVLTKGPLGAVLVGVPIAAHMLVRRNLSAFRQALTPIGIGLFLIIAVPWFVLMEQANPGFLDYFIVEQHLANIAGEVGTAVARHPEPAYYFLAILLLGFFPWSLVLPQSVYCLLKHREARGPAMDFYLVAIVLATLLIFSLPTSKLATYILPLFPAAAILVGRYWDRLLADPARVRKASQVLAFGAVAVGLVLTVLWLALGDPVDHLKIRSGINPAHVSRFLGAFGLLFLLAALWAWQARHGRSFTALAVAAPAFVFFVLWGLAPGADPYRSSKLVAARVDAILPAGEPIHVYGRLLDSAAFYTGRQVVLLDTEEEVARYLSGNDQAVLIARSRNGSFNDIPDIDLPVLFEIANKRIYVQGER
jgi:4-amino-4-deoxy-L-arabinose transferase-like glycosyltransferase